MSIQQNALNFLSVYNNSDSDSEDEVPGPRVSVKRCHKDDEDENYIKCFKSSERVKLPVPSIFKQTEVPKEDNRDEHGGRIRTFPHERGNWSTFVYIPYENNEVFDELIEEIILKTKNLVKVERSVDLHISLTKTVVLRHHWIEPFVKSLTENISHIKRFVLLFGELKIYCNEERTRTFIGLTMKSGYDTLLNIVEVLNKCLLEFNLPTFYTDPSFHMSLVWCVGDYEAVLTNIVDDLNNILAKYMTNYTDFYWYILVRNLICKSGNKFFKFNLSSV